MLSRREFAARPNFVRYFSVLALASLCFIIAIIAACTHVTVVDDRTDAERVLLLTIALLGVPAFGALIIFLAAFAPRILKLQRALLVLDEKGFTFQGIMLQWSVIRKVLITKSLGQSYVGVRSINDVALVTAMDRALAKRVPYIGLLILHWQQSRTQCPLLIPPMQGISIEDLCKLVESYRNEYGAGDARAEPAT